MKGNNELILNEATMIEIVQLWVESVTKGSPPVVRSVKGEHDDGMSESFRVTLQSVGALEACGLGLAARQSLAEEGRAVIEEDVGELKMRLREHAACHDRLAQFDDEQKQWAKDLHDAANKLGG